MPSGKFPPEHELMGAYNVLVDSSDHVVPHSSFPLILQPAYVLSIRPERMIQFAQRLGPWMIHCKRPPCVVGKTLDKQSLHKQRVISRVGGKMKVGQIGCWLSHLKAWECIAAAPYAQGTIFEDDADVGRDLRCVETAMNELKQKNIHWDVLYWCMLPMPHVKRGLRECGLTHWMQVPKDNCMGCIAYTITQRVAKMWVGKAKPIYNPVDVWVAQDFGNLQVYCIRPELGYMVPSVSDTENNARPGYLRYL
jgi:GR25 family glycosyltransferase involved in LPS biosynthesis